MSDILFSVEGHVARIRLNRPSALNAMTASMDVALQDAWNEVNSNPAIWAVVLSGEGEKAFCVGADLKDTAPRPERIAFGGGVTGVGGPLLEVTKPIIAGVQGYVLGGGFELAMCADIIVAADTTQFGLPETAVGVIGECGVVHRAIRQLPYRVALGLILTGRRLSAAEALHHGLINEVVEPTAVNSAAESWCERLLACSPLAVQAAKDAAISQLGQSLPAALATRFEPIERYASSKDFAESREAFLSKRPPNWRGY